MDDDARQEETWKLDESSHESPLQIVTRRDELGRATETVEVTDPVAASHWREKDWRPVR